MVNCIRITRRFAYSFIRLFVGWFIFRRRDDEAAGTAADRPVGRVRQRRQPLPLLSASFGSGRQVAVAAPAAGLASRIRWRLVSSCVRPARLRYSPVLAGNLLLQWRALALGARSAFWRFRGASRSPKSPGAGENRHCRGVGRPLRGWCARAAAGYRWAAQLCGLCCCALTVRTARPLTEVRETPVRERASVDWTTAATEPPSACRASRGARRQLSPSAAVPRVSRRTGTAPRYHVYNSASAGEAAARCTEHAPGRRGTGGAAGTRRTRTWGTGAAASRVYRSRSLYTERVCSDPALCRCCVYTVE